MKKTVIAAACCMLLFTAALFAAFKFTGIQNIYAKYPSLFAVTALSFMFICVFIVLMIVNKKVKPVSWDFLHDTKRIMRAVWAAVFVGTAVWSAVFSMFFAQRGCIRSGLEGIEPTFIFLVLAWIFFGSRLKKRMIYDVICVLGFAVSLGLAPLDYGAMISSPFLFLLALTLYKNEYIREILKWFFTVIIGAIVLANTVNFIDSVNFSQGLYYNLMFYGAVFVISFGCFYFLRGFRLFAVPFVGFLYSFYVYYINYYDGYDPTIYSILMVAMLAAFVVEYNFESKGMPAQKEDKNAADDEHDENEEVLE